MKRYISLISIITILCIASYRSLGSESAKSSPKSVVIQYTPDNADTTKLVHLASTQYSIVEQFCKPMLSPTGNMAYLKERQSVIIYDKKSNVDKIVAFIKKIDVPSVNIRIDVDFLGSGRTQNDKLNVAFGNKETPGVNNKIIFKDGKMVEINRVNIDAVRRSGRTTRNTSQFIVTQSGHPASLWVGKTVVDPSWLRNRSLAPIFIFTGHGNNVIVVPDADNNIRWSDIGSSLYVCPTYLGNGKIKLELYPVVSYLEDNPDDLKNNRKHVRKNVMVQDLKTSLVLHDGQRISVGGLIGGKKDVYTSLFGPELFRRDSNDSVLDMYVRATVIKPGTSGRRSYIPRTPDVREWKK